MLLINILNNTLQQFSLFFSLIVNFFLQFSFVSIRYLSHPLNWFLFFLLFNSSSYSAQFLFFFTVKRVTRIKFVIDSALCDLHDWILFIESPRHQARRFRFWHRRQSKSTIVHASTEAVKFDGPAYQWEISDDFPFAKANIQRRVISWQFWARHSHETCRLVLSYARSQGFNINNNFFPNSKIELVEYV